MKGKRYPWTPFEKLLDADLGLAVIARQVIEPNDVRRAERLGLRYPRQIKRWRENGVTERQADALATAIGLHAVNVWPELEADIVAALSRTCAAPDCTNTFIPTTRNGGLPHRYCHPRCAKRVSQRRKRRTAEGRARARASAAKYYRENREYCLKRQRRYDTDRRARAAA